MDALLALQQREAAALADFNSELSRVHKRLNERLDEINTARYNILNGVGDEELGLQTTGKTRQGTILEASATASTDVLSSKLEALALDTLGSSHSRVDIVARPLATRRWPRFWLQALLGCSSTRKFISRRDEKILIYLDNFKVKVFNANEHAQEFELAFYFCKNPYFTNEILSRTFCLDDVKGESHATSIDWLPLGENGIDSSDDDEDEDDEDEDKDELDDGYSSETCDEEDYDKDGYYGHGDKHKRFRASFFDFFYNGDSDEDLNLAAALLLKVYRSPLKYVARYLTQVQTASGYNNDENNTKIDDLTLQKLVEIAGEVSEDEDDEKKSAKRGNASLAFVNSAKPGGRYPFSWVFDLWQYYNRAKED